MRIFMYTVAYNSENTIGKMIESVLAQTYKDFTLYIVNNASTDNTAEVIKKYAESDSRVKYLENYRNLDYGEENGITAISKYYNEKDYFCYGYQNAVFNESYFEIAIKEINKEESDIIAFNYDMNYIDKNKLEHIKLSEKNIVVRSNEVGLEHDFYQTTIAKFYKNSLMNNYIVDDWHKCIEFKSHNKYYNYKLVGQAKKISVLRDVAATIYNKQSVFVYTMAYNAQETIERTIRSILNQSHRDFTYYILDNGSTDNTYKILQRYSKIDKRIILLKNEKNYEFLKGNMLSDIVWNFKDNDFFCWIDADDEYKEDFLKESMELAKKSDFDIIISGNDFIQSENNTVVGVRRLEEEMILNNAKSFSNNLNQYHQFLRTIWGKLYKVKTVKYSNNYDWEEYKDISYGGDTRFVIKTFEVADNIIIIPKSFYNYYIYKNSSSYKYDKKRVKSDQLLQKLQYDFINKKSGEITMYNQAFLLVIYLNALKDTVEVIKNADITDEEKLNVILDMCSNKYTKELALRNDIDAFLAPTVIGKRKELLIYFLDFLLTQEEIPDDKLISYCEIGEYLSAAIYNIEAYISFKKIKIEVFEFLEETEKLDIAKRELSELLI